MTQATETRQIRLLIDGVLAAYEIDNLELSIKLTEGVKRIIGAAAPAKTREDYLASLKKSVERGLAKHELLQAIAEEIERRVKIRPVTKDWQDFIEWAYRRGNEGETITRFLDWWLSDEWQKTHPPTRPDGWYVKWPQAFVNLRPAKDLDDSAEFNPMESY